MLKSVRKIFGLLLSHIQSLLILSDLKPLSREMHETCHDFPNFEIVTVKLKTCGVLETKLYEIKSLLSIK